MVQFVMGVGSTARLHTWILQGLSMGNVVESGSHYLDECIDNHYACALGLALIGKEGSAAKAMEVFEAALIDDRVPEATIAFGQLLDIPMDLAQKIDLAHRNGISAREIATSLA
ncbi:MAG TPA: hypothetical protein VI306_09935 [Pyrinomonadaceae bacterium]